MLPAFVDDVRADFWIPETEFRDRKIFPEKHTTYFPANASLDLGGGFIVDTMEITGHTSHSTVFFLKNRNVVFTGDAVGSGSGVWLFDYDSFIKYRGSIGNLIVYIEDPQNGVDSKKLEIHGGHAWQRGRLEKLTTQYVYDMRELIKRIGQETAETELMSAQISFLDTNFKYGTATITWNEEAAAQYAESVHSGVR
jgi:glyoxylase-like metal-dependent hydrolase (beta-lactamase superfamily II)